MLIAADVKNELVALLQEYVDIFSWSDADMPSLDIEKVVHKLPLIEGCKSVKQKLLKVKEEITR
jgi:hypothetical protein